MDIFHAIILGIVEGLTEFLPVSSTGHLIVSAKLLGLNQDDFLKTFEIVIQTGAVLAVVPLFLKTFFKNTKLVLLSVAAFIPTAIVGLLLHGTIRQIMSAEWIVGVTLAIGGAIMILTERIYSARSTPKKNRLTLGSALYIGLCQACAVIPGVSRSGATIVGGLAANFDRTLLVTFSFLLSVPTIIAAGGYDLMKTQASFSHYQWTLLGIGFVTAWISAALCVRWFLRFISKHSFEGFGWYRVIAGILFLIIYFI